MTDLQNIPFDALTPWSGNPRDDFDSPQAQAEIAQLAETIRAHGTLSSLIVRPAAKGFEVIAGGRRYAAVASLVAAGERDGAEPLPCQVRDLSDVAALEVALAENLERRDLHPLEEAEAMHRLVEEHNIPPSELGPRLGVTPRTVQQRLHMRRDLGAPAKKAFRAGAITTRQARLLAGLCPKKRQSGVVREICGGGYGYRTIDELRHSLRQELVPLEHAFFDPFDYPRDKIAVDSEHELAEEAEALFAARDAAVLPALNALDVELFVDLQRTAIEAKAERLRPRNAFVKVLYPDADESPWHFKHADKDDDRRGVVISVSRAWQVEIHPNRLPKGAQPRRAGAAPEAAAEETAGDGAGDGAAAAEETVSLFPTAALAVIAHELKQAALRDALVAAPLETALATCLTFLFHRSWEGATLFSKVQGFTLAQRPRLHARLGSSALRAAIEADDPAGTFLYLTELSAEDLAALFVATIAESVTVPTRDQHHLADPAVILAIAKEVAPETTLPATEDGVATFAKIVAQARRPLLALMAQQAGIADGEKHGRRVRGRRWLQKTAVKELKELLLERAESDPSVVSMPLPILAFHGEAEASAAFTYTWPAFAGETGSDDDG